MRTMFMKLFFWFWLAMTLSGMVFFLLAFTMRLGPLHDKFEQRFNAERAGLVRQTLVLYGREAAAMYERSGTVPSGYAAAPGMPPAMRPNLFSADGTPLSGDAPPHLRDAVRRLSMQPDKEIIADKGLAAVAVRVRSPRGKTYLAATELMPPQPPPREPPRGLPFPPDFWFRFAITFVIGGLVCYGLAWRLTAPVRHLREATQRLAGGDMSARVPVRGGGRGDEVSDLTRDFNSMAERIERLVLAQKQLVRDVSHELRSPLARLNVALGLARRDAPPSTVPALDRIEQEAERLNGMIGELLTLSLLESDSERFRKETFDLAELVEEVARDVDYEATGRNRRVQCVGSTALTFSGNRDMLRRALENVMRNAVRYTPEGTAVEASMARDTADVAVIRVRDHGPGVPETALSDIFRPFFRSAEARDRLSGGAGIGLAITEQAVRLHSGDVRAFNAPDGGLVVEIRLPVGPGG